MSYCKVRNLSEQCGILTGATSGVGRALAKLLAERGTRLIISGRRESRLIDLASEYPGVLIPLPGDIANSRFQEDLVEKAKESFGGIDLVIAAAGVGAVGPFSESSSDTMRSVFEIDFFAPIDLVYKSLPQLKNGRSSVVVLIGSILGVHPLPLHGGYAAAKAALHGFANAVRPELASLGIDVKVAILGPTESEFWDNLVAGERASWSQGRPLSAETTAAAIIATMEGGAPAVTPGWRAKTYVFLARFFPALIDLVVRWKRRLPHQS